MAATGHRASRDLVFKLFLILVYTISIASSQSASPTNQTQASSIPPLASFEATRTEAATTEAATTEETTAAATTTTTTTTTTTEATTKPEAANLGENSTTDGETLLSGHEFVDFNEAPTLLFDGTSSIENNATAAGEAGKPKEIPSGATETISPPVATESTTGGPTTPTADDDDEEPTNGSSDDDDDDEPDDKKAQFELPQNVSQYMDYIERLFHDLRHQIADLFEPHLPQLIRSSQMVQLSGSCSYDMLRMALALRQFEPWALRMIDSSGKMPEGIFEGSFTALGSYDECLNTVFGQAAAPSKESSQSGGGGAGGGQTQGKYCLVNVSPFLPPKPPADRVERMFQEEANRRNYTKDNQFSRLSPMFYYMKFRIGICIPSTCTDSDMDSLSEALSSSLRLNITIPHCKIRQSIPMTSHQLIGGLIFASVSLIVLLATLMDYSRRKLDRQRRRVVLSMLLANHDDGGSRSVNDAAAAATHLKGGHFLDRLSANWSWMSFSVLANYRLYFEQAPKLAANKERPTSSQLAHAAAAAAASSSRTPFIRCLNGIRVISLCWVIVANSYITLDPRATKRLTKTREAPKDFLFQMIAQASLAIETFFFLSGVLMSLSYARKLKPLSSAGRERECCWQTANKLAAPARLPKASAGSSGSRLARLRWLQFYVHRWVRMTPATMLVIAFTMYAFRYGDGPLWFEATHKAHQSCSQNWWRHLLHVANFIDSRQMCFIHYWYRKVGYALVTLIGAASIGSIFYTTYMRNLPPTLLFYNSDPESRREFGNTIMTKPLTHALPYLVGMLVGKWLTGKPTTSDTTTNADHGNLNEKSSAAGQHSSATATATTSDNFSSSGNGRLTTLFGAIATLVALAEVFLPYKWNNSHLPTRFLAALYAALFRFAWSLVLAYIIMSCRHKRGRRCRPDASTGVNDQPQRQPIGSKYPSAPSQQQQRQCSSCMLKPATFQPPPPPASKFINISAANELSCGANYISDCNISQPTAATMVTTSDGGGESSSHLMDHQQAMCFCGSGGNLVNRLLSLELFTHLSKLSFVAYLIHLPLMSVFIAQTRGLFAFSHTLVIHLALSYLMMTFLFSFVLVHIIELPFLTFERFLFERLFYSSSAAAAPTHTAKNGAAVATAANTDQAHEQPPPPLREAASRIEVAAPKINCFMSNKSTGSYTLNALDRIELSERL